MALKIDNTRTLKSYLRNLVERAELNQEQRSEGTMPIITSITGYTTDAETIKGLAKYDKNLAALLEKVEAPIKEVDTYIIGRKFDNG